MLLRKLKPFVEAQIEEKERIKAITKANSIIKLGVTVEWPKLIHLVKS